MAKINMINNMDKDQLMKFIYCLGFCADDMQLYLDTHPDDAEAIEYFNQCNELLKKTRREYEMKYGALLLCERDSSDSWDWNMGKMPWEGVNN